jgi:2-polyprenyl-6-methoxyphenol hydroxylase-like FAD-dependent oxidoreductase
MTYPSNGAQNPRVSPASPGRGHAVVIGGSIAGLVCARVLADHFARVTVLERDPRPEGPEPRKGAPQMRHAHAVLGAATDGLRELFPGFMEEMERAGAVVFDLAADIAMYHYSAWKPRFRFGSQGIVCSRPFIEWHVRRRVHDIPSIDIRYQHVAEELLTDPGQGRVTGVRVKGPGGEETLTCDLVVDTAGRGTRAPRWLEALGYGRPEEEAVGVDLAYTSRLYQVPPGRRRDWVAMVVYSKPPARRGGFVFEIEGGRWIVSLPGYFGDHCPTDDAGFLEFARSLPVPDLHDAIAGAEPLTPPSMHKIPSSRWFRYEKMKRLPDGLVMVGDSVCSLNPIYGQGMMVAIQCALALGEVLHRWPAADLHGFPHQVQKKLAAVVALSWMLSTTMDLSFPDATGKRPPWLRTLQWTFSNLIDLSSVDEGVCRIFYDLLHARRGPEALAHPALLVPLLAYSAKTPFIPREKRTRTGTIPSPPA